MSGKAIVGYVDTERGRDALALGRLLAKAHDAELAILTVEDGDELAGAACEESADLVVIGSAHRGAVGQTLFGTTMEHLLGEASCPVAVAPPGFAARAEGDSVWLPLDGTDEDVGMRVVGVGFDGTPASRAALETATELALRNGAALRVYSVARRNASIAPDAPMTPTPISTTELERRRAELHETVAGLPAAARALPVMLRGFAADELISASRFGVDLMVVGTHVGHLRRRLHKSVAAEVASGIDCPVLICPTPVADAVGAAA